MADPTATYRAGPPGEGAGTAAGSPAVFDNPVPLGLLAFSTATLITGTVLAGWWPYGRAGLVVIAPMLLVFGGVAQFVVAMWCYARRHAVAATFFGAFGSLYTAVALYSMTAPVSSRPAMILMLGPLAVGVGCFAFIALILALALAGSNIAFSLTSFLVALSLILLTWALFAQDNSVLEAIGGWIAVIAGFVGFLTATGLVMGQEMPAPKGLPGIGRARPARPQPTG